MPLPALPLHAGIVVAWAATSLAVGAGVYRSARHHNPFQGKTGHAKMGIFAGLMWPAVSAAAAVFIPVQCIHALVKPNNIKIDLPYFTGSAAGDSERKDE